MREESSFYTGHTCNQRAGEGERETLQSRNFFHHLSIEQKLLLRDLFMRSADDDIVVGRQFGHTL